VSELAGWPEKGREAAPDTREKADDMGKPPTHEDFRSFTSLVSKRGVQRTAVTTPPLRLLFLAGTLAVGFVRWRGKNTKLNRNIENQRSECSTSGGNNLRLKGLASGLSRMSRLNRHA